MPTKRRASVGAASSPMKRRSRVSHPWDSIAVALENAEELPKDLREMFAETLENSLGIYKDQRHQFQESAVEMVGQALCAIEARLKRRLDDAQSKVDGSSADREARDAAKAEKLERLQAAQEAAAAAHQAAEEGKEALKAARAAKREAEAVQSRGDVELISAAERKARLEAVQKEAYEPLKDGLETDQHKKQVRALLLVGREFKFDASLVDCLPTALRKVKSDRRQFDDTIVQLLGEEIANAISKYDNICSEGEPAKAERAAATLSAQTALTAAEEVAEKTKAAAMEAVVTERACNAELRAADRAVHNFLFEMRDLMDELDQTRDELAKFQEGPQATFSRLRDATSPPPAPPTPLEDEDEAAPEDAPEPPAEVGTAPAADVPAAA